MTNILVVDDEEYFLDITKQMLENKGYSVALAFDVEQALSKLENNSYELVLADVHMPDKSGLDLLGYITRKYTDTFVLMVSGRDNPEVVKWTLDLGACGYLLKPLKENELHISIINALKMRKLYQENTKYQNRLENLVQERTLELEQTIDDLTKVKDELHTQLEFQHTLMEAIPSPIFYKDRSGVFLGCNQAFENFIGSPREQIVGKTVFDFSPKEDAQKYKQMDEKLFQNPGKQIYDYQVQTAKGNMREVVFNKSTLSNHQGEVNGILGIITDVTEQNHIERSLRENQDWLQSIFNGLQAGILVVDGTSLEIVDANAKALELLDKDKDELVGKGVDTYIVGKHLRGRIRDEVIISEAEIITSKGQRIPVQKNLVAVNLHGKSHLLECFIDIREQKKAQERLEKAKQEIQQVLEAISSALISVNTKREIFRWNRFAEEIFEIASKDAVGHFLKDLALSWQWSKIDKGLQDCEQKQYPITLLDIPYTRQDKRNGFLNVNIYPIKNENNEQNGCLLLCEEVTEKRILEGQLQQSQKLDAIGQLAAGIAHEINTPTQYVGDNIHFLQDAFEDLQNLLQKYIELQNELQNEQKWPQELKEIEALTEDIDLEFLQKEIPTAISQSLNGVKRVAEIVESMKRFSHPGTKEKTPMDINDSLRHTITISRNEWKYVADLQTELEQDLPAVMGYAGALNQVFLNLILNAAQAIAEQGKTEKKGNILISSKKNDDYVQIEVTDNGPGIDPDLQEKIFEPFFTTKEVGKGTGQGLSLAYNTIVEKHNGQLTVQSQPDQGATFTVILPLNA